MSIQERIGKLTGSFTNNAKAQSVPNGQPTMFQRAQNFVSKNPGYSALAGIGSGAVVYGIMRAATGNSQQDEEAAQSENTPLN